jgi:hypothetical protein
MKIKKLQANTTLKSYKELCSVLEIQPTTGNAKLAQLKELERFCKFERSGNSYTITEIYQEELPKSNNITQYIPMIEKLVLHIIIQRADENNRLYIRKAELYRILYMINEEYTKYKYQQIALSKRINVTKQSILDFYSSSDALLQRNLEVALNNLQRQSLIKWGNVFTVDKVIYDEEEEVIELIKGKKLSEEGDEMYEFGGKKEVLHSHVEATKEETEIILGEQRRLLLDWKLKDLDQVFQKGFGEMFYTEVKRELLAKHGIANYYNSYSIIFNMAYVLQQYEALDKFILNDETQYQLSIALNAEIVNKNTELATNRHKKSTEIALNDREFKDNVRAHPKYVQDTAKITKKVIQK